MMLSFDTHSNNNLDESNSSHLDVADPGSSDSPSFMPTDPVYRCRRHGPTFVYIYFNDVTPFDSVNSTIQYPYANIVNSSPIQICPRDPISRRHPVQSLFYNFPRAHSLLNSIATASPYFTPLLLPEESPKSAQSTFRFKLIGISLTATLRLKDDIDNSSVYQIYYLSVPCVPSNSYQSVLICFEYQYSPYQTIDLRIVDPKYTIATPLSSYVSDSLPRFRAYPSRTIYYLHFTLIFTQQCQSLFRMLSLPNQHLMHPTDQHGSIAQSSLISWTPIQPIAISMTTLIPSPSRPHKTFNMTQNHIAQQYISSDQLLNLTTQHSFPSTTRIFKTDSLWNTSTLQPSQLLIADVKTKIKALKTKTNKNSPISYTFFSMLIHFSRLLLSSSLVRGPLT